MDREHPRTTPLMAALILVPIRVFLNYIFRAHNAFAHAARLVILLPMGAGLAVLIVYGLATKRRRQAATNAIIDEMEHDEIAAEARNHELVIEHPYQAPLPGWRETIR